jgi:hypothetical protein
VIDIPHYLHFSFHSLSVNKIFELRNVLREPEPATVRRHGNVGPIRLQPFSKASIPFLGPRPMKVTAGHPRATPIR